MKKEKYLFVKDRPMPTIPEDYIPEYVIVKLTDEGWIERIESRKVSSALNKLYLQLVSLRNKNRLSHYGIVFLVPCMVK